MGNCAQRLGRDCGFKYQQYYGQNPEELDQYLREVPLFSCFIPSWPKLIVINRKSKLSMRYDSQIEMLSLEASVRNLLNSRKIVSNWTRKPLKIKNHKQIF